MKPLVIITEHLDQVCADWLAERAEVVWCKHEDGAKLDELLPRAEALVVRTYTQVNAALLAKAPKLKVVGRAGVGLDNVDLGACEDRCVKVVYTPDANTQAVVEYVTALLLDAFRPREAMPSPCDEKTFHAMRKTLVGTQLDQLTLGILGFGRIGKRIGQVAIAIGMKVIAHDLLPEAELRKLVDYPFEFVPRDELFERADVLTIHVDGRAANRNLIDGSALSQLNSGCLLINTSRGFVIDAPALKRWATHAADKGGRAVLDVHEPEPPPADYCLWGVPNVRLLPHLASRTGPAMENMSWVVRDVAAVLAGDEPRYPAI